MTANAQKTILERWLALALLILLCVAIWLVCISPLIKLHRSLNTELALASLEHKNLQQRQFRIEKSPSSADGSTPLEYYWIARDQNEALAKIQSAISNSAQQNNVGLRSIAPQASTDLSNLFLRLDFEAEMDAFLSFMNAIETTQPGFLIEETQLRRIQRIDEGAQYPIVSGQILLTSFLLLDES